MNLDPDLETSDMVVGQAISLYAHTYVHCIYMYIDRQRDRQTDRWTDGQMDRWIDKMRLNPDLDTPVFVVGQTKHLYVCTHVRK